MYHKFGLERNEISKRALKYLIISLAVAYAANNIPQNKMNKQEVTMIAITAACMFAIVDMYAPTVSNKTTLTVNRNRC